MTLRINRGSNIPPKLDNNLLLIELDAFISQYIQGISPVRAELNVSILIGSYEGIFVDFSGLVQIWCPGLSFTGAHQCERSIFQLVVPVQKLEHGTRVRALSPKVVFRHRTRARALVCTRFHQCHAFYPCFPAIWSYGGDNMAGTKWTVDETIAKTKIKIMKSFDSIL